MPWVPLAGEMGALALGPAVPPRRRAIAPPGASSAARAGLLTVFREFRRLIAALEGIKSQLLAVCVELSGLRAEYKAQGPASERLELLEQGRHQFEALCEGLLLKAEGKHRAANNAEARERQMKKSYEHLIDPLAEGGLEPEAATRGPDGSDDAAAGEAARLQALRLDVAPSPKALAQRAKFGVR